MNLEVKNLFIDDFRGKNLFLLKIQINEWYCSRWDCAALYKMKVRLVNESGDQMDEFVFKDIMEGDRQNIWFNVSVWK